MDRRKFLASSAALSGSVLTTSWGFPTLDIYKGTTSLLRPFSRFSHRLPQSDGHYKATSGYIEDVPVSEYFWASDSAYEAFLDMKFGIRIHWGLYSIVQQANESWPYLTMSFEERQAYQELYKAWYPADFDATAWMDFFADSGARMFAFTAKHHDGFSLFDTKARVRKRVNWLAPGGPLIENCDEAYSIMEAPFKRDIVKELCDAAHKKGIKIDLYFSHPDWHDADFRPYNFHPIQVPDSATMAVLGKDRHPELQNPKEKFGKSGLVIKPNPGKEEVDRMMMRHRDQLKELITSYGQIDMIDLDQWLGPEVWPRLRETMIFLRKLRPDIMYRARGVGNYGDYYTPEGFVPGDKENTDTPWFVIYPLGKSFSYDPHAENYQGSKWIIQNVVDSAAKGGNFMAAIGPDGTGKFHPTAIEQLKETGSWLKVNGKGIYATRPRRGDLWKEGDHIRYTRSKDNRTVYAFVLNGIKDNLIFKSVKPRENSELYLMGVTTPVRWKYDSNEGLIIEISGELKTMLSRSIQADLDSYVYGFEIPV
jgi:alpha-L-fucosidase